MNLLQMQEKAKFIIQNKISSNLEFIMNFLNLEMSEENKEKVGIFVIAIENLISMHTGIVYGTKKITYYTDCENSKNLYFFNSNIKNIQKEKINDMIFKISYESGIQEIPCEFNLLVASLTWVFWNEKSLCKSNFLEQIRLFQGV